MSETSRGTSTGPGRILIAVYAVFALAATGRSSVQLIEKAGEAPLAYVPVRAGGGGLHRRDTGAGRGRDRTRAGWRGPRCWSSWPACWWWARSAWWESDWFPDDTVWSRFGSGYGWLPLVLPFFGVAWLLRTRPDERTLAP